MLNKTAAAALCVLVSQTFAANATDGVITFNGELIAKGCSLVGDNSSSNKNVPMGKYPITALSTTGDSTPKKNVALSFKECPQEDNINVVFSGEPSGDEPSYFKVLQKGAPVKGIGLSLTQNDKPLTPNETIPMTADEDGNAELTIQANYVATSDEVKSVGELASVVNVDISYN